VVDRHQQAIGFHQFAENLLEQIFHVGRVRHPLPDEMAQPGAFLRDDCGDLPILFDHRGHNGRLTHLPV